MTIKTAAQGLFFLKPLLNLICIVCLICIPLLFLFSSIAIQNQYAIPSLVLAVWSLLFSALLGLLVNAPDKITSNKSWWSSLRYKFTKRLFTLSIIAFIFMTLALLHVSIKLIGVWL
jgi:hypothetical protein